MATPPIPMPEGLRAPQAPPPAGPWCRIVSVGPNKLVTAIVLSERPVCLWTHWLEQREFVCTARVAPFCAGHAAGQKPRWSAFVVGVLALDGPQHVFRITEGAARNFSGPHFREHALSMRGHVLTLNRLRSTKNAPLKMDLRPAKMPLGALADPIDLSAFLMNLFRVGPELLELTGPFAQPG